MPGHFTVFGYPHEDAHPYDIGFQLQADVKGNVPKEQASLKSEVEKTLNVLRALFAPDHEKFRRYFAELLALSQYGLVGPTAQPVQAMNTLENLQQQILDNEKGRAISAYVTALMKSEAIWLLIIVAALVGAGIVLHYVWGEEFAAMDISILLIAPGLFVGLTFSAFVRCRAITFYELHAIEADRFSPILKVAFAAAILFLAAAFLKAGVFEIKVGKTELSNFDHDYLSAFVFGAIVGIAQEAIIAKIESIKRQFGPVRRREAPNRRRR
jgi:hypothetical protein